MIDYYSEDVRLEIEALPVAIRASYARLTELLEEFGLELRMPHSRAMGGGLFELRPRGREGRLSRHDQETTEEDTPPDG
jgi:hypothetical protein